MFLEFALLAPLKDLEGACLGLVQDLEQIIQEAHARQGYCGDGRICQGRLADDGRLGLAVIGTGQHEIDDFVGGAEAEYVEEGALRYRCQGRARLLGVGNLYLHPKVLVLDTSDSLALIIKPAHGKRAVESYKTQISRDARGINVFHVTP